MNKLLFLLIFFIPIEVFSQREFFSSSFISVDNENQINIRSNQGISTELDSLFKKDSIFIKRKTFVGISNGIRYYKTNINEPTYYFNESKIYIKSTPFKRFTTIFNPSLLISKNFSTFSYEFSSSYQIKKFYFEASSERDLVGARALMVNLVSNYYGLSVDYNFFKGFTLVGGYQYNYINDNNKRHFLISRIIYTLPNEKIYFDFRTKDMKGGTWSPYYFSPEKISQKQIGFGFNDSFFQDKMAFGGYLGTGLQTIDTETMYLLVVDFKFKSRITKKLVSEGNFGVRNFNKYIYGFTNLKLKYIF